MELHNLSVVSHKGAFSPDNPPEDGQYVVTPYLEPFHIKHQDKYQHFHYDPSFSKHLLNAGLIFPDTEEGIANAEACAKSMEKGFEVGESVAWLLDKIDNGNLNHAEVISKCREIKSILEQEDE